MKIIQDSQRDISIEIEKISNRPFYSMNYYGDDCFDEYLLRGARSLDDYCAFIDTALIRNRENPIGHNNFGCGAFVAQSANSDILFARNMDCECAIPMLLRLNDNSSYRFLSLVNMAFLDWDESTYDSLEIDKKLTLATAYSPSDGINEYGFAVAILTDADATYPKQNDKITLFDMTLPRLLLSKARSVEEAIHYTEKYNFFYDVAPLHYMVADASGHSAVIEFVDGKMVVTKAENKYQVVTNFTLFDNPTKTGFGKDRYENILNALEKQRGIISEEDALELLKSNVIPGDEQWSAVYNLTQKTLSVTFSGDYENVYRFKL
ncbi:MAG: linear amide C-N hydrolase [Lachnospiraceae bacterium]|nr:linear amide C-N hydrolase [Lachnospiraceae bacterium]